MADNQIKSKRATGDAVAVYLREMGKHELLTKEEEIKIFKRIEKARRKANRILNAQVGTYGRYTELGHKILNGEVRFDEKVDTESKDRYMKGLKHLHLIALENQCLCCSGRGVGNLLLSWYGVRPGL